MIPSIITPNYGKWTIHRLDHHPIKLLHRGSPNLQKLGTVINQHGRNSLFIARVTPEGEEDIWTFPKDTDLWYRQLPPPLSYLMHRFIHGWLLVLTYGLHYRQSDKRNQPLPYSSDSHGYLYIVWGEEALKLWENSVQSLYTVDPQAQVALITDNHQVNPTLVQHLIHVDSPNEYQRQQAALVTEIPIPEDLLPPPQYPHRLSSR